ncbi:MAG: serine/threonine-protein kinase [bacterium]
MLTILNKTISRYKIIEKIGEGGMGEVYLAEDLELKRKIALKFLSPEFTSDKKIKARFKREARTAANLNHPNIITVYEIAEYENRSYIAMEYVEGKSLKDLIAKKELPISNVIDISIQICEGLSKAHQEGVVHRDIKPENIMIDKDGRVKILDFGLAKLKEANKLTSETSTLGTLYYMSPEQTQSADVDRQSDIFSFGVILYEMITGQLPFRGEYEAAISYSINYVDPEPLARFKVGVSEGLQRIVDKALDKNRETRYQNSADFLADLKKERNNYSEAIKTVTIKKVKPEELKQSTFAKLFHNFQSKNVLIIIILVMILTIALSGVILWNHESWYGIKELFTTQKLKHSVLIQELSQISNTEILKEKLSDYAHSMKITVGKKEDFDPPDGCYVFIVDSIKVWSVLKYKDKIFFDLSTNERYSRLSDKFTSRVAIWVKDYSNAVSIKNITP